MSSINNKSSVSPMVRTQSDLFAKAQSKLDGLKDTLAAKKGELKKFDQPVSSNTADIIKTPETLHKEIKSIKRQIAVLEQVLGPVKNAAPQAGSKVKAKKAEDAVDTRAAARTSRMPASAAPSAPPKHKLLEQARFTAASRRSATLPPMLQDEGITEELKV